MRDRKLRSAEEVGEYFNGLAKKHEEHLDQLRDILHKAALKIQEQQLVEFAARAKDKEMNKYYLRITESDWGFRAGWYKARKVTRKLTPGKPQTWGDYIKQNRKGEYTLGMFPKMDPWEAELFLKYEAAYQPIRAAMARLVKERYALNYVRNALHGVAGEVAVLELLIGESFPDLP